MVISNLVLLSSLAIGPTIRSPVHTRRDFVTLGAVGSPSRRSVSAIAAHLRTTMSRDESSESLFSRDVGCDEHTIDGFSDVENEEGNHSLFGVKEKIKEVAKKDGVVFNCAGGEGGAAPPPFASLLSLVFEPKNYGISAPAGLESKAMASPARGRDRAFGEAGKQVKGGGYGGKEDAEPSSTVMPPFSTFKPMRYGVQAPEGLESEAWASGATSSRSRGRGSGDIDQRVEGGPLGEEGVAALAASYSTRLPSFLAFGSTKYVSSALVGLEKKSRAAAARGRGKKTSGDANVQVKSGSCGAAGDAAPYPFVPLSSPALKMTRGGSPALAGLESKARAAATINGDGTFGEAGKQVKGGGYGGKEDAEPSSTVMPPFSTFKPMRYGVQAPEGLESEARASGATSSRSRGRGSGDIDQRVEGGRLGEEGVAALAASYSTRLPSFLAFGSTKYVSSALVGLEKKSRAAAARGRGKKTSGDANVQVKSGGCGAAGDAAPYPFVPLSSPALKMTRGGNPALAGLESKATAAATINGDGTFGEAGKQVKGGGYGGEGSAAPSSTRMSSFHTFEPAKHFFSALQGLKVKARDEAARGRGFPSVEADKQVEGGRDRKERSVPSFSFGYFVLLVIANTFLSFLSSVWRDYGPKQRQPRRPSVKELRSATSHECKQESWFQWARVNMPLILLYVATFAPSHPSNVNSVEDRVADVCSSPAALVNNARAAASGGKGSRYGEEGSTASIEAVAFSYGTLYSSAHKLAKCTFHQTKCESSAPAGLERKSVAALSSFGPLSFLTHEPAKHWRSSPVGREHESRGAVAGEIVRGFGEMIEEGKGARHGLGGSMASVATASSTFKHSFPAFEPMKHVCLTPVGSFEPLSPPTFDPTKCTFKPTKCGAAVPAGMEENSRATAAGSRGRESGEADEQVQGSLHGGGDGGAARSCTVVPPFPVLELTRYRTQATSGLSLPGSPSFEPSFLLGSSFVQPLEPRSSSWNPRAQPSSQQSVLFGNCAFADRVLNGDLHLLSCPPMALTWMAILCRPEPLAGVRSGTPPSWMRMALHFLEILSSARPLCWVFRVGMHVFNRCLSYFTMAAFTAMAHAFDHATLRSEKLYYGRRRRRETLEERIGRVATLAYQKILSVAAKFTTAVGNRVWGGQVIIHVLPFVRPLFPILKWVVRPIIPVLVEWIFPVFMTVLLVPIFIHLFLKLRWMASRSASFRPWNALLAILVLLWASMGTVYSMKPVSPLSSTNAEAGPHVKSGVLEAAAVAAAVKAALTTGQRSPSTAAARPTKQPSAQGGADSADSCRPEPLDTPSPSDNCNLDPGILPDDHWVIAHDKLKRAMEQAGFTWKRPYKNEPDYTLVAPGLKDIKAADIFKVDSPYVEGRDFFRGEDGLKEFARTAFGWKGEGAVLLDADHRAHIDGPSKKKRRAAPGTEALPKAKSPPSKADHRADIIGPSRKKRRVATGAKASPTCKSAPVKAVKPTNGPTGVADKNESNIDPGILPDDHWVIAHEKLKWAGFTSKTPTGLQTDWTWVAPRLKDVKVADIFKADSPYVEGRDFFRGEDGLKEFAMTAFGWRGEGAVSSDADHDTDTVQPSKKKRRAAPGAEALTEPKQAKESTRVSSTLPVVARLPPSSRDDPSLKAVQPTLPGRSEGETIPAQPVATGMVPRRSRAEVSPETLAHNAEVKKEFNIRGLHDSCWPREMLLLRFNADEGERVYFTERMGGASQLVEGRALSARLLNPRPDRLVAPCLEDLQRDVQWLVESDETHRLYVIPDSLLSSVGRLEVSNIQSERKVREEWRPSDRTEDKESAAPVRATGNAEDILSLASDSVSSTHDTKPSPKKRTCTVPGCTKWIQKSRMCQRHFKEASGVESTAFPDDDGASEKSGGNADSEPSDNVVAVTNHVVSRKKEKPKRKGRSVGAAETPSSSKQKDPKASTVRVVWLKDPSDESSHADEKSAADPLSALGATPERSSGVSPAATHHRSSSKRLTRISQGCRVWTTRRTLYQRANDRQQPKLSADWQNRYRLFGTVSGSHAENKKWSVEWDVFPHDNNTCLVDRTLLNIVQPGEEEAPEPTRDDSQEDTIAKLPTEKILSAGSCKLTTGKKKFEVTWDVLPDGHHIIEDPHVPPNGGPMLCVDWKKSIKDMFFDYFLFDVTGHAKIMDNYLRNPNASCHRTYFELGHTIDDPEAADRDWRVKQWYLLRLDAHWRPEHGLTELWKKGPKEDEDNSYWPDFGQWMSLHLFKCISAAAPYCFCKEHFWHRERRDKTFDIAHPICKAFNARRRRLIPKPELLCMDESFSPWLPKTTALGGASLVTMNRRKPKSGIEMKASAECVTGILMHLDIVDIPEKQQQKEFFMNESSVPDHQMLLAQPSEVMRQVKGAGMTKGTWACGDAWFGSVLACVELFLIFGVYSTFIIKGQMPKWFPLEALKALLRARHGRRPAGHWVVLKATISGVPLLAIAYAWNNIGGVTYAISSCGLTTPGHSPYESKFENEFGGRGVTFYPRPKVLDMLYSFLPALDEGNVYRQDSIGLEKTWETEDVYSRILMTITGMAATDTLFAFRNEFGDEYKKTKGSDFVKKIVGKGNLVRVGNPPSPVRSLIPSAFPTLVRYQTRRGTLTTGPSEWRRDSGRQSGQCAATSCWICRGHLVSKSTRFMCPKCETPLCNNEVPHGDRQWTCKVEHTLSPHPEIRCDGNRKGHFPSHLKGKL